MSNFGKAIGMLKKDGFKKTIRHCYKKMTGCDVYEDQFNTLFYFLNNYCDISTVPPAKGDLREMQLCDVLLVQIIDKVCKRENIKCWLDFGSLLGARRHKGFIPWDDDVDMAVTREDYNKALQVLPSILGEYGIDAREEPNEPLRRIGIGYKHKQTGVWVDLFPVDHINTTSFEQAKPVLTDAIYKYRKFNHKNLTKKSAEEIQKKKDEIFSKIPKGDTEVWFHVTEGYNKPKFHKTDDIFPLAEIEFEGVMIPCPANCDAYLTRSYGPDFMGFPKTGVLHHGGEDGKLDTWARKNNIDLKQIHNELREILDKI